MSDIWITSDQHFGHKNILNFEDQFGDKIRPGFESVDHMDEYMIDKWNEMIKPGDKVYHLGDVALCEMERADRILRQLNGQKRMLWGNHDKFDHGFYRRHFKKIELWRRFADDDYVIYCTHVPMHPDPCNLFTIPGSKQAVINVHGHIHQNKIDDPRFYNVCVEHTNYTPVNLDTLISHARLFGHT